MSIVLRLRNPVLGDCQEVTIKWYNLIYILIILHVCWRLNYAAESTEPEWPQEIFVVVKKLDIIAFILIRYFLCVVLFLKMIKFVP